MLEDHTAAFSRGDPQTVGGALDELVELERVKAAACARQAHLLALGVVLAEREAGCGGSGSSGSGDGDGGSDRRSGGDGSSAAGERRTVTFGPDSPARRRELVMRSFISEVGCALRLAEGTVGRLICDAQTLTLDLPDTLQALRSGQIAYRHAQILVQHALSLPPDARRGFEQHALPAAEKLTPARFDAGVKALRERLHPESIVVRHEQAAQTRCVFFEADRDGMAWLHHRLAAVDAMAIDDQLDQVARGMRSDEETRTHAQLRADALTEALLVGGGASSAIGRAAIVPTVVVTVPVLTLLGRSDDPAELEGFGPIDPETARELAARAPSFIRMLTDPDTGETLSVGRKRYYPSADMRLALRLADVTCRFPGCGRRAPRCELDHCAAWSDGGATTLDNLHHLCSKHHHLKHESNWTVSAGPARRLNWTSPAGRHYSTDPVSRATAPLPPLPIRRQ
jgi:hypothetical protein